MFKDQVSPSFPNCLLYGLEFDFLILEVLIITFMYRVSLSSPRI